MWTKYQDRLWAAGLFILGVFVASELAASETITLEAGAVGKASVDVTTDSAVAIQSEAAFSELSI